MRWLVERGEDINAEDAFGRRPLHTRVWQPDQIPLLLELGAAVNATCHKSETPLHTAVAYHREQATDALLAGGADPTLLSTDLDQKFSLITHAIWRCRWHELHDALPWVERCWELGARPTGTETEVLERIQHRRALESKGQPDTDVARRRGAEYEAAVEELVSRYGITRPA